MEISSGGNDCKPLFTSSLKSDRFGMEIIISVIFTSSFSFFKLKSDRFGMEIGNHIYETFATERLKSDRFGMEMLLGV